MHLLKVVYPTLAWRWTSPEGDTLNSNNLVGSLYSQTIAVSGNLIKQKALTIYEHLSNIGYYSAGRDNH